MYGGKGSPYNRPLVITVTSIANKLTDWDVRVWSNGELLDDVFRGNFSFPEVTFHLSCRRFTWTVGRSNLNGVVF